MCIVTLKPRRFLVLFFALVLEYPRLPICIRFLKYKMLKLWGNVCKKNNWRLEPRVILCFTKFYCSTWALQSKHLCSLNFGNCCSLQQMLPIIKLHRGLLPVLYTNQKFINENTQARWVPNVLLNRITEKYSSSWQGLLFQYLRPPGMHSKENCLQWCLQSTHSCIISVVNPEELFV